VIRYFALQNARILLNLSHIHKDPKIWGDPENFRPERFLNESGALLKNTALVPFGIGKNNKQ
jgi:methyl farnesoate epoxidase / farnesoate epoxidase